MNRLFFSFLVGVLFSLPIWGLRAEILPKDFKELSHVAILHEGRVKPLDTFARVHLLAFYGKSQIPGLTPTEWLVQLLFDAEKAFDQKVFNISNPEVVSQLGLEWSPKHRFSFDEVSKGLRGQLELIGQLSQKDKNQLTVAQNHLVETYLKVLRFFEISRSLSIINPIFVVQQPENAKQLKLSVGQNYSYLELFKMREPIAKETLRVEKIKPEQRTKAQQEMFALGLMMSRLQQDSRTDVFKVIPPQWSQNHDNWFALWEVVERGQGSPQSAQLFQLWRSLGAAYASGDTQDFIEVSRKLKDISYSSDYTSGKKINLEVKFNHWDLFVKSLAFYIFSFLCLALSWMIWPKWFYRISAISATLGLLVHGVGIVLRMMIMSRPPVTTLYESILFVGFIAALFALIYEAIRKNQVGLIIATTAGAILHFIGLGYADDGDSMGMLVAVLNTNFWLATHVVTISIGYGCCYVGGVLGHIYLIRRMFRPNEKKKLSELYKNMVGISLFALFFAMFGTILGGIWADQSWGRFWGWDPKENGALLIVLWLLWLLHGRIAGLIKELGYALGMVFTNVIVALAWFGVNLLNIGLHSYGFTDSIALNLALFCGVEVLFIIVAFAWIQSRHHSQGVSS